jgi:ligand-binding sensor domain-containing protein
MQTNTLLLTGTLLLLLNTMQAQQKTYRHFTVKEGLAGNNVYYVMQDKKGYIWVGTETGLSKYDGTRFRNFYHKDGLPDNEVLQLAEDRENRLWILSFSQALSYIHNDTIYNAQNTPELAIPLPLAGTSYYQQWCEDPVSGNWFSSSGELLQYLPGQPLKRWLTVKRFSGRIENVYPAGKDHFYIVSRKNIYLWNKKTDLIQPLLEKPDNFICQYRQSGNLFFASGGNQLLVYQMQPDYTLSLLAKKEMPYPILGITTSRNGSLCISFHSKGCLVYPSAQSMLNNEAGRWFLEGRTVTSFCNDHEDNNWFSTLNDGLYMVQSTDVTVRTTSDGLFDNNIITIAVDKETGTVYGGYTRGVVDKIEGTTVKHLLLSAPDSRNNIYHILPASDNNIYVAANMGLYRISKKGDHKPYNKIKGSTKYVYETSEGTILAGNYGSLFTVRNDTLETQLYTGRCISIAEDARKRIYIGTQYGIFIYDKNQVKKLTSDSLLSVSRITGMRFSPGGLLWVATNQNGIFVFKDSLLLTRIHEGNGLSSNICKHLRTDGDSTAWVATHNGACRIQYRFNNSLSYTIDAFDEGSGLPTNEINDILIKGDSVWMATPAGLVTMSKHTRLSIYPPLIYVSHVSNGRHFFKGHLPVELGYPSGNLDIFFSSVSFNTGGFISYRYMLEGADDGWSITTANQLSYSALKPGTYTFIVYAITKNGVKSTRPARIQITIHPAWWQRRIFKLFAALLAAALLYLLYRSSINQVKKSEAKKTQIHQRMADLELQAIRARMNPHFIFNVLTAIQGFIAGEDKRAAHKYLSAFASLIRNTLDHSRNNLLLLGEETEMLKAYMELEKLRFKNKFNYEIIIDPALQKDTLFLPGMLLQPHIENAINHGLRYREGDGGLLHIHFRLEGFSLVCTVKDNGIGIERSRQLKAEQPRMHRSEGMNLTIKRIEVLNIMYNIQISTNVKTGDHTGTEVTITIPDVHYLKPKHTSHA